MQVILCALAWRPQKMADSRVSWVVFKRHFKSVRIYFIFLKTTWFLFLNDVRRYCTWNFLILVLNYRNGYNFGVAHIRQRIDVFEEFAIDYNLTAHTLIRYGQKYIAQWEINTKRKHKRAKDHLHDTHSLRVRSKRRANFHILRKISFVHLYICAYFIWIQLQTDIKIKHCI